MRASKGNTPWYSPLSIIVYVLGGAILGFLLFVPVSWIVELVLRIDTDPYWMWGLTAAGFAVGLAVENRNDDRDRARSGE